MKRRYKAMQRVLDSAIFDLNGMAEVVNYHKNWGDEFCIKQIKKSFQKTMEYLKDFDFKSLTVDELVAIGFRKWDENVILCPLWAVDLCLPELNDRDIRMGCVAYGWKFEDNEVLWDEKAGIN